MENYPFILHYVYPASGIFNYGIHLIERDNRFLITFLRYTIGFILFNSGHYLGSIL